jgi:hypothetical protein
MLQSRSLLLLLVLHDIVNGIALGGGLGLLLHQHSILKHAAALTQLRRLFILLLMRLLYVGRRR